jgi:hypothetical protein
MPDYYSPNFESTMGKKQISRMKGVIKTVKELKKVEPEDPNYFNYHMI